MHEITVIDGLETEPGSPYLFGTTLNPGGCNFALFSKNATQVYLLLFNSPDDRQPTHTIKLDNRIHKTGDVWHIFIHGISEGQFYGYCVDGPYWPERKGHRFNVNKLLLDPYAQAITGDFHWIDPAAFGYNVGDPVGDLSFSKKKNFDKTAKCVVVDRLNFNWEGDKPLNVPLNESIIYEMHVRAFTIDKSAKVSYPGTFLGIIEKIPYLKELGVTTIELLPVHEFNHMENTNTNPITKERLYNFWGYSTLGFFAPDGWYSSQDYDGLQAVYDFKEMVKELHKAGIEVILDVVYNHTGEGNEYGPTVSFKGLDNSIYYMLEQGRYYKNYSGCGNTLNCNHPVVKRMIKESLRYWVVDMHVDGFRFDLAAILGRDKDGHWVPDYSVLSEISHDPILSNTKIIAEGWDAAGLYKVGNFPQGWAEWNAAFRDGIRGFIKGDGGMAGEAASRISGSADLFHFKDSPYHSINFITAHDGFTLYDTVSYNDKHNEQNGEDNRDGHNHNLSWNCGVEGETDDPEVNRLRDKQMKNLFVLLMVSLGTPMMLAGDEMKFSKMGNNNTYCHDNRLNHLDWALLEKNRQYFDFCKYMIHFRKNHPVLCREHFFTGLDTAGNKLPDISWHGTEVHTPDWGLDSHSLAYLLDGSKAETGAKRDDNNIYVAINSYWADLYFKLPETKKNKMWYKSVDTSEMPGYYDFEDEPRVNTSWIKVQSRSIVVLIDK